MTEMEEIMEGKDLPELEAELKFQVNTQGEALGGNLLAPLVERINQMKQNV